MSGTVNIIFRDSLNRPIEVEVEGLGRGSTFSLRLPGGHVRTLVTSGSGPLKVGYVTIEAPPQLAGVLTYRIPSSSIARSVQLGKQSETPRSFPKQSPHTAQPTDGSS